MDEEKMKCPSCTEVMKYRYKQQGGVRTHESWICERCKLDVRINAIAPTVSYESPIAKLRKWMEARRR